jgi:hypothetical protein
MRLCDKDKGVGLFCYCFYSRDNVTLLSIESRYGHHTYARAHVAHTAAFSICGL